MRSIITLTNSSRWRVSPYVLVDDEAGDAAEAGRISDQQTPALGEDGFARPRPGHAQCLVTRDMLRWKQMIGSKAHRSVRHDSFALGSAAAMVLAPYGMTPGAGVAADRDQQRGRAPAQRFVHQPARD